MAGDFNARIGSEGQLEEDLFLGDGLEHERKSMDLQVNARGKAVMELVRDTGMIIVNGRTRSDRQGQFTYMSWSVQSERSQCGSVIDLFCIDSNSAHIVKDLQVLDVPGSDHFPVKLQLKWEKYEQQARRAFKLKWNPNVEEAYQEKVMKNIQKFTEEGEEVNIRNIIKLTATEMKLISHGIPRGWKCWFDEECREARRLVQRALKRAKEGNWKKEDRSHYNRCTKGYATLKRRKKTEYWQQQLETLNKASTSQKFWHEVKKFRMTPMNPNPVEAEQWKEFYERLMPLRSSYSTFEEVENEELDGELTIDEIEKAVKCASNSKAPGLDGICNEFYKNLPESGLELLLKEFNNIWETRRVPEDWSVSETVMLFKKGNKDDPMNYRPIALAVTQMKLFTHILAQRLMQWAEKHKILPEAQAGFRKNRSCQEQIFNLTGAIQLATKEKGRQVYAMFIDFQRAFPSVPHDKLWNRLHALGVSTRIVNILQQLYVNASTKIRLGQGHSEELAMTIGLLQGDSLSPLLFALYIHDIEKVLQDAKFLGIALTHEVTIHTLLFADDTVILAPNAGQLRKKIKVLEEYFKKWDLIVNMDKTKVVVFRKGGRVSSNTKFHYNGEEIEIVNEYVYLGVLMSSSALFAKQVQRMKEKSKKVSRQVISLIYRTKLSNFHSHYTLYESVIKPTLLYASAIWSHRYKKELEPIQNNYYRQVLGLRRDLSTCVIRSETASKHIECSIWRQTLKFILTVKMMDANRYAYIIFHKLIQLDQQKPSWEYNWITQVRQGLTAFGLDGMLTVLPENFMDHYEGSIKVIHEHFKEHDEYMLQRTVHSQYWEFLREHQEESSHTEESKQTEDEKRWMQLPWYLQADINLQRKKLIAQLRQDYININIQGNRVTIPSKREGKECTLCNLQESDCPSHVLFTCPITSSKKFDEYGWNPGNYFEFLQQKWEDTEEICSLITKCFKTKHFIEAETTN